MQSILDLQNTLLEIQDIIDNTINPVFTDLGNASHIFDPVVVSHNTIIQKLNETLDYLSTLQTGGTGSNGLSAYEIAQIEGFVGTVTEWLQSLKGEQGIQGIQGIQGEKGDKGDTGANGLDGLNAYQVAQQNGFNGTVTEWLDSLVAGSPTTFKSRTTIIENSNQSYVRIPELTTPLTSGIYEFELYGTYQTVATTTGIYLFIQCPPVPNKLFVLSNIFPATGRQSAVVHQSEMDGVSCTLTTLSVTTANSPASFVISGKIVVTSDGEVNFDFASEIANSKVTINKCFLFVKKI